MYLALRKIILGLPMTLKGARETGGLFWSPAFLLL
jgi:hypothetical protein